MTLAIIVEMVASPVVKILTRKSNASESSSSFYALSGDKILLKNSSENTLQVCVAHPETKRWTSVAALSSDEKLLAVCDCEKNLYLYEISSTDPTKLSLKSVPMRLAKTATSVKFTSYPSEWTVLVADKFGDVLRFQIEEEFEFDRWAQESQKDAKSLSIHSKSYHGKRTSSEANDEGEACEGNVEAEESEGGVSLETSEAHNSTIIGHISMITDLQVLSIINSPELIVTCDRDEKVRLTRADRPEIIHSFGLGHREFVGTLAVNDATGCIYSAGGDNFIAEWKVDGDKLNLIGKIGVKDGLEGIIQEIKIDSSGKSLFAHVEGFGILHYIKNNEIWTLESYHEIKGITAFEIGFDGCFFAATWCPKSGVSFYNTDICISEEIINEISCCSVEEAVEIIDSMSKSKLKKDVERMDWKQKKHANQKPRN